MSCGVFGIRKHREIYHKSNHNILILVKALQIKFETNPANILPVNLKFDTNFER